MSPKNNLEQREARELAAAEGVNYTTALRMVRREKAKQEWLDVFASIDCDVWPKLRRIEEYPTREEWEAEGEGKPYRPLVTATVHEIEPGSPFSTFADLGPEIASSSDRVDACVVTPVGMLGADGVEIPGTVGNRAFRVWSTEEPCASMDPLDPALNRWLRQFLVLAFVMPRLSAIEGLDRCTFESCEPLSHEAMLGRNITVRFKASPGVGVADIRDRIHVIKDVLGVRWALVEDSTTANPMVVGTTIALHLGDGPRGREEPSLDLARTQLVLDIIRTAQFTAPENANRPWSLDVLRQAMLAFKDSTLVRLRDALGGSDRGFAKIIAGDILSRLPEEQMIDYIDRVGPKHARQQPTG